MSLTSPIAAVGRLTLSRAGSLSLSLRILLSTLRAAARMGILNHAVLAATARQLYLTAIRALPAAIIVGLIVGMVGVNYILRIILDYIGAYDELGNWLMLVMLEEIAPIFTTLIILLRSGTAVIAELSLMNVNNELKTLEVFGIKLDEYIYLPRVVAFAVAGPALTVVFCLVGLIGSFVLVGYFHNITFDSYLQQLYGGVELRNLVVVLLKPFLMSIAVALIAIQRGLKADASIQEVPVLISRGMMLSMTVIILVEVGFALFFSI